MAKALPAGELPNIAALRALEEEMAGDPGAYRRFVDQAQQRPVFEPYAAFAPFNEASRALYPLIPALRRHLAPGDLVVDVWCRTGWTGALLAGLFPEQQVVSLWDGHQRRAGLCRLSPLAGQRGAAGELDHRFCRSQNVACRLADGAVALLHAADSLHRFDAEPFLDECLRVTASDGALVFPHVHLANNEPDPFFERGGTIRHGSVYRRWLDDRLKPGRWSAYVLSERALFERVGNRSLADEAGTSDYNALIAILSDRHGPYEIGPARREFHEGDRLIPNPLVAVDTVTGRAARDSGALAGRADYLLKRHPVYAERLAQQLPATLTADDRRVLYWATLVPELTLSEIQAKTDLDPATFHDVIRRLEACDVAHAAPVGAAMARLQHFYATRRASVPLHDQQFAALWRGAGRRYAERPLIMAEDGSTFDFSEAEEIVGSLSAMLRAKGAGPQRPLAIICASGTEAILAIWAAWLLGAAVVPIDATLPAPQLAAILERVNPALVLVEAGLRTAVPARFAVLLLAADGASDGTLALGDEIANHAAIDLAALPPPDESMIAAILFTSGSTGQPKGVRLTQGALWRGAHAIAGGLGWNENDILLSAGGLHTMSGLRNPCVAALVAGATIVLPDPRQVAHPATLADAVRRRQATLLAAVPAMISAVVAVTKQKAIRFAPLRQVAVTGSTLSRGLQQDGERAFGTPVQVYYGLTETAGVCLLVPPGESREADGDVGVPAGAVARIVDEAGSEVSAGEVGELQIYNANLTAGYLDEPAKSAALFDRGWLRTGDLARWSNDGHVILLGRRDEQIKNRFGEIVQPAAIESVLHKCDGLDEAAVVGIGDGADIRIVAFVVAKGVGGADWLAGLQARVIQALGSRQCPDRFIEKVALPRLSSGKIARQALRV